MTFEIPSTSNTQILSSYVNSVPQSQTKTQKPPGRQEISQSTRHKHHDNVSAMKQVLQHVVSEEPRTHGSVLLITVLM